MIQLNPDDGALTLIPILCLLLILSACSVGPNYQEPDISSVMNEQWLVAGENRERFDPDRQPMTAWWQQFNDPELSRLIAQLVSSSRALAEARQRIVEVSARQGVVDADRWLQLSAAFGYTHAETGDQAVSLQGWPPGKSVSVVSAGVVAGWELDIWGRTARLLEAAEEDVRATYGVYHGLMVSLAAELTLAYIDTRTLEARLENVRETIVLQEKSLRLLQTRLQAGNGSTLEVVRAKRFVQTTRARIPDLEKNLSLAKNRISLLLGLPPGQGVLHPGPLPSVPLLIGVGLPIDLMTRRPDIRQAVHHYHGSVARIGAAEAERYPALRLSGTLNLSSDTLGNLLDADALIYSLGPGLSFPIINGGRIESVVAVRTSQAEQARLVLEQKIIAALAEVENAAAGVLFSREQTAELLSAEQLAAKSAELAESLYRAGLSDSFQVLSAQQELITIQESLFLARQQALSEVVRLYRSLGGGWEVTLAGADTAQEKEAKQNIKQ
ncbi:MAG: efflux transporter outer membrane subunit [Desulfocapsaceae bacterium]|jgi:NodT family efflux transporter outer membrane factor (OMF) lipoprotein|nr:efflux transporter outer membrane subunit [Desulfocapsaceae bacterium]